MLPVSLVLSLVLAPAFTSAALFPKSSHVKMLDAKGFKKAMEQNITSMVAFVAPWCGHCQRMSPEYSKTAAGLTPLVPLYAVDCDAAENKPLCAQQGVQGFPTVKLYPRGRRLPSKIYEGAERTASGFYYFVTRGLPNEVDKVRKIEDLSDWLHSNKKQHRVVLLNKSNKIPLLWRVLANKYTDMLKLGNIRDKHFVVSKALDLEGRDKNKNKVVVYAAGARDQILYEGVLNYNSLTKFFDSIVDGTADLKTAMEAAEEDFDEELDEEEYRLEQERQQAAMEMAHGGMVGGMADMLGPGAVNPHEGMAGYEPGKKRKGKKGKKSSSEASGASHPRTDAAEPTPEAVVSGEQPNTAQKPFASPSSPPQDSMDNLKGAIDDETIPERSEL